MKENKKSIRVIQILSIFIFICGLDLIYSALTEIIGEGSSFVEWLYLITGIWFIFGSLYNFYILVKNKKNKWRKVQGTLSSFWYFS